MHSPSTFKKVTSGASPSVTKAFQDASAGGTPPCERYGHSMVVDNSGGGLIVVFGGCDAEGTFYADLHMYNVERNGWLEVEPCGAVPKPRTFHSAVAYDGNMVVFGGLSNGLHNDLHVCSLDTQEWTCLPPTGKLPSPRYGHSAVVYNDVMYVFGGYDKDGFACNDLHALILSSYSWTQINPNPKGVVPKDVYHHTAVVYQGSMYTFGGYRKSYNEIQEYRFGTNTWSFVRTHRSPPTPRWGHSAVVVDGVMYVLAGRDRVTNFCDVHAFDYESRSWSKVTCSGLGSRFFSTAVVHDDQLFVFGGTNVFHFFFNDLLCIRLGYRKRGKASPLVADFRSLLNNPELADVKFVFPEEPGRSIYAHRNILCARCEPFAVMMSPDSQWKEAKQGVLTIGHTSHDTFYALLEYVYTGCLYVSAEGVMDLLQAAALYQLNHLKRLCEHKVKRYLDEANVLAIMSIAVPHDAQDLTQACLDFISKHEDAILSSDEFAQASDTVRDLIIDSLKQEGKY